MSRSTEKKAVFFDADGTLCDMEKGVPASTKEALKKLRENGLALYRKKQSFCILVSGRTSLYRNDQCLWSNHRKRWKAPV